MRWYENNEVAWFVDWLPLKKEKQDALNIVVLGLLLSLELEHHIYHVSCYNTLNIVACLLSLEVFAMMDGDALKNIEFGTFLLSLEDKTFMILIDNTTREPPRRLFLLLWYPTFAPSPPMVQESNHPRKNKKLLCH